MGVSPRKMWAVGLGLAGFIYLVAPSQGQQPKSDPRVQGTGAAATATRSNSAAQQTRATVIGTIDLEQVFKNYDKTQAVMKELQAAAKVRQGELMKFDDKARSVYDMMKKLNPSSKDYRDYEAQLTELKAKMEAGREQAEREFALRQAETMATLYKEIQAYTKWVAEKRGITHVLTASSAPPAGSDPNSVMAAISRPVVYNHPANDITEEVIHYLNQEYQKMVGKTSPKAAPTQQPAGVANTRGR